jgi:hypothetical protein
MKDINIDTLYKLTKINHFIHRTDNFCSKENTMKITKKIYKQIIRSYTPTFKYTETEYLETLEMVQNGFSMLILHGEVA